MAIFDWMFLSSIEMAYDFSKNEGMHRTDYGVEKASGQIFELKFIVPDYEGMEYTPSGLNSYYYPADRLITALEENKLKGKLKEIVQHLDEEDNGVVMILRRKEFLSAFLLCIKQKLSEILIVVLSQTLSPLEENPFSSASILQSSV